MPYILEENRPPLDPIVSDMLGHIEAPGDLAYVLFKFLRKRATSWTTDCTWAGTVFLTLLEFYRSSVGPYEERRKADNGDVE